MSRYDSWSLRELRAAVAGAMDQMDWIDPVHTSFADSSHNVAYLGDDLGLSRNAVAAAWTGVAGAAATQSASNLQAYSQSTHAAIFQSATATRELGHATRNHYSKVHGIEDVNTSFSHSLAQSGGNPVLATQHHQQQQQKHEVNRRAAVHQAEALDAKGREYNRMMKQTQWPTLTSSGSVNVPPPTHYPVVPSGPDPVTPVPVTPTPVTPHPTRPVTTVVMGTHKQVDGSGDSVGGGTSVQGLAGVGGSGGAATGLGGLGGSGLGGSGLGGSGLGGSGLGGSGLGGGNGAGLTGLTGGLAGGLGAHAGQPLAAESNARGSAGRGGLADEGRGSLRGGGMAAEEGRGGMYGPGGGGRRNGGDDEEKRRPDYLEEDDDPWGLGIEDAVPAVIGEEDE